MHDKWKSGKVYKNPKDQPSEIKKDRTWGFAPSCRHTKKKLVARSNFISSKTSSFTLVNANKQSLDVSCRGSIDLKEKNTTGFYFPGKRLSKPNHSARNNILSVYSQFFQANNSRYGNTNSMNM
jgi:hypothetical protein